MMFCMSIEPIYSITWHDNCCEMVETKKAWEFLLLAHPCVQAFALPLLKDKQRSQPTPSDYIYNNRYTLLYIAVVGI